MPSCWLDQRMLQTPSAVWSVSSHHQKSTDTEGAMPEAASHSAAPGPGSWARKRNWNGSGREREIGIKPPPVAAASPQSLRTESVKRGNALKEEMSDLFISRLARAWRAKKNFTISSSNRRDPSHLVPHTTSLNAVSIDHRQRQCRSRRRVEVGEEGACRGADVGDPRRSDVRRRAVRVSRRSLTLSRLRRPLGGRGTGSFTGGAQHPRR